jgi:hypothetical protein
LYRKIAATFFWTYRPTWPSLLLNGKETQTEDHNAADMKHWLTAGFIDGHGTCAQGCYMAWIESLMSFYWIAIPQPKQMEPLWSPGQWIK